MPPIRELGVFETQGGTVSFLDEGRNGLSVLVKGLPELIAWVQEFSTFKDLYRHLAPRGTPVPRALERESVARAHEPGDRHVRKLTVPPVPHGATPVVQPGPDECGDFENWKDDVSDWIGFNPALSGGGLESYHLQLGNDPEEWQGLFGTSNEIWAAVCVFDGGPVPVEIKWYDPDFYGPPFPGGEWLTVGGGMSLTEEVLNPGEAYYSTTSSSPRCHGVSSCGSRPSPTTATTCW